jgi:hypothetical protein
MDIRRQLKSASLARLVGCCMHAQDKTPSSWSGGRDLTPPREYNRQLLGFLNHRQQHTQAIPGRAIIGCTCIVESVTTSELLGLLLTTIPQRPSIFTLTL